MFEQIFNIMMYILALYGIISLAVSFIRHLYFGRGIRGINSRLRMVLVVKNQEDVIEGIIRSLYASRAFEGNTDIYVVDMDSQDKTRDILQRLSYTYRRMEILSSNESEKIFEGFEDENINKKEYIDKSKNIEYLNYNGDIEYLDYIEQIKETRDM